VTVGAFVVAGVVLAFIRPSADTKAEWRSPSWNREPESGAS
jgi:hypothetical protein